MGDLIHCSDPPRHSLKDGHITLAEPDPRWPPERLVEALTLCLPGWLDATPTQAPAPRSPANRRRERAARTR
jgi:hypothetical protein